MDNVDLFLKQLTYLPFKDVINMCQVNKKYHNYCTLDKYNNNWKAIIDNTFSDIYNYNDKINKIWQDLDYNKNRYDYMVYVNLIKYLDPITQLMIYHRQKDTDSFNDAKYNNEQRVLALFLLGDKQIEQYFDVDPIYRRFIDLFNNVSFNKETLSRMVSLMSRHGNVKGVKYLHEKGANIHYNFEEALKE